MERTISATEIFPWQEKTWRLFLQCYQQQKLPHAVLLQTATGLGALSLAEQMAKLVLCQGASETTVCGACNSCKLFNAVTHPDYLLLQTETESNSIKVAAIRQLNTQLTQSAQLGSYKVVVIDSADALNLAASNALLKILEEPGAKTLFILISKSAEQLPATLRSRCQRWCISPPADEVSQQWLQHQGITNAQQWLALVGGAPLLATQFIKDETLQKQYHVFIEVLQQFQQQHDPIKTATAWVAIDVITLSDWLSQFYMDLLRIIVNCPAQFIVHQTYFVWLKTISAEFSFSTLFSAYDRVLQLHRLFIQQRSLNMQLQLEAMLIDLIKLYQRQQ